MTHLQHLSHQHRQTQLLPHHSLAHFQSAIQLIFKLNIFGKRRKKCSQLVLEMICTGTLLMLLTSVAAPPTPPFRFAKVTCLPHLDTNKTQLP